MTHHLPVSVINHDVPRFHITMHDSSRMDKIQSLVKMMSKEGRGCGGYEFHETYLEELESIVPDIYLAEYGV